ncbi:MAG: DUF3450 family protein [Myxococcales bacterium]|nr:DUF3450 family protein [Myxococcales bacterium]
MRHLLPLLLLLARPGPARAEDAGQLAASLVALRSEVEHLTDALEDAKRARRERQRALAAQQAQIEAELAREKLRARQLREAQDRKKAEIERAKAEDTALLPVFAAGAEALRGAINASLPFRRNERAAEVQSLADRLEQGLLTPRTALTRLWALVEDELQLARDAGLARATITLDGEELLADVVRLGLVGLYFRTGDDRVGFVARRGDGWQTRRVEAEDEVAAVDGLFDAFKKQIRVGYHALPNIIPPGGR